jgi:hypothetical protein
MAPIYQIETSVEKAKVLRELGFNLTDLNKSNNNFIYVPSINLYVAKERTLQGANWFEAHKQLQGNGERMLTVPEFVEFLKYVRENNSDIYEDITAVRSPRRAEWLDADFKVKKRNLHINYNHVLDSNGNLIPQSSEPLDRNTLMEDRKISLESWLSNPTEQGFPTKKVASGNFYYLYPRSDNNSVARFVAGDDRSGLGCSWGPSGWDADLGVRACRVRG